MAITLRQTSTGPNSNATSTTISLPTGTTVNDLTIIAGSTNASTGTYAITIPAGWTTIFNGGGQFACYRLFQSGDPSSVSFSYSAAVFWETCAVSYTGCDTTTPVDTFASCLSYPRLTSAPNVGFYRAPSINPSWNNDLLVAVYLNALTSNAGVITLPGSFTQRVQTTLGPNVNISDRQVASAAATGTQSATWSTASNVMNAAALVALHASGDTAASHAPATMSVAGITGSFSAGTSIPMGLDHLYPSVGDLMVLAVSAGQAVTSAPSGWTQAVGANNDYVYTRPYQAGDANPAVGFASSTSVNAMLLLLRPSYGPDTPTIDVSGTATGTASTVLPSLTPTGTNEYLLGICMQSGAATTWTPSGSLTTIVSSGAGPNVLLQEKQGNSAATGTFTIGSSNGGTVQGYDVLVALAPVTAGAGAAQARVLVMA